jgi:hypothetical protein
VALLKWIRGDHTDIVLPFAAKEGEPSSRWISPGGTQREKQHGGGTPAPKKDQFGLPGSSGTNDTQTRRVVVDFVAAAACSGSLASASISYFCR